MGRPKGKWIRPQEHHGLSHTSEYKIWLGIKMRCLNPRRAAYSRYGARGITICDRWKDSFAAFYTDMGSRPSLQHSIERKDNDGNYEPSNCIWLPKNRQSTNRRRYSCPRRQKRFKVNGKILNLKEASAIYGIKPNTIRCRLLRGWSPEQAMNGDITPRNPVSRSAKSSGRAQWWDENGKRWMVRGEFLRPAEITEKYGIKADTFLKRIRYGWNPEEAALTKVS